MHRHKETHILKEQSPQQVSRNTDFYHKFNVSNHTAIHAPSMPVNPFETIVEACQEGILTISHKGVITSANHAAHQIFGYELGQLVGSPLSVLIPEQYRAKHGAYQQAYASDPQPRQMGVGRDLYGLRQDGNTFPIEISLNTAVIFGETQTVAFVIDITVRKEVEEALRRSEEQLIVYAAELEKRVQERTKALEQINQQLGEEVEERKRAERETRLALEREQELNTLKSRFVSTASHEFRTPLSTILSSTSLIERYASGEMAEKQGRHIGKIRKSINHLNQILEDFLNLSRLEEGKVDPKPESCDLPAICKSLREELQPILRPGQQINLSIEGSPKPFISDPRMLKNIGTNLLSNAIKYSPENSQIHITLHYEPAWLRWSVADQGIGIPESEQKYLFDRFFRAQNAVNLEGTGLGLHIVKKYLEVLQGSISFVSVPNEGSTFTITLPASYAS